ncbi:TauD/TfdA family dioxygenase [Pseudonocardia sp. ICBG1293]|uniref:TauD/TfdA family dioxygenase n=1 Tax=Pseudonocardia sp. ICBG1293 TaxID=2844382 RepID=UPI001CCCBB1A|nr:TauD/TfdA family dioxygenase [Pseudonocardia sp. ICBG1293]
MLDDTEQALVEEIVHKVHENCPGQTEYRYLNFLREHVVTPIDRVRAFCDANKGEPVLVNHLPRFDDVEHSKILALLLGRTVGVPVAYSDYNGSYITDIRPTELSKEKSSGTDLLAMHNDLAWADDVCRPRTLVLVPHVAEGAVPCTLLAPARTVVERLAPDVVDVLCLPIFEARAGSSLGWGYERVRQMPLIEFIDGAVVVRLNFSAFTPISGLAPEQRAAADAAHQQLHATALEVGRLHGHAAREGEALIIPNDHCLHGRDPIDTGACRRLLLRSYVVPDEIVEHHGRTMISLEY